jgi:hypothetical protein
MKRGRAGADKLGRGAVLERKAWAEDGAGHFRLC